LIRHVSPNEFRIFDQRHNHAPLDDKISRQMLSESKIVVSLYGAPIIGFEVDGELVSINITSFAKSKRKNAWGRYVNFYLAYTVPDHRYKGYASQLVSHIERIALEQGYNRMKSLAGSYAGVRLHMHFGHQFWGIATKRGELIVDTPLRSGDEWPDGVPEKARTAGSDLHLMGVEEIASALLAPRFSVNFQPMPEKTMADYVERWRR
jgi:GNAT superfamily N-acetyltransferase